MSRTLNAGAESWPIAGGFTISRGTKTEARVVAVEICDAVARGRGECVPYARYGETVDSVIAEIEEQRPFVEAGGDRFALRDRMKAGAARNAIDCALLDIEAKRKGVAAWRLLDLPQPEPLLTAYTISLGTPEKMAADAARAAARPLLKVKLGGNNDPAAIAAVRRGAPEARLIVDANEGWTADTLAENLDACADAGVELIEQPLPADDDTALKDRDGRVTVCADESVHTAGDLAALADRYDAVNIKLDKAGGMTEARAMLDVAADNGLKIMIGCMLATSLAMAPACLLAGRADYVDLDGPLLLSRDRVPGLVYYGSMIEPPRRELWG